MAVNSDFIIGAVARLRQFETLSTTTRNDLSALALVSNLNIAIEKMKDGYIFGTGFDSHQMYYDKYIAEIYGRIIMAVNKEDCASLYIRIFSEFGIIGFLIFVIASQALTVSSLKNISLSEYNHFFMTGKMFCVCTSILPFLISFTSN